MRSPELPSAKRRAVAMFLGIGIFMVLFVLFIVPLIFKQTTDGKDTNMVSPAYPMDPTGARMYWDHRLDEVPPAQVYTEFENAYQSLDKAGAYHRLSHVLGELLYEKLGVEGVAACREETNYGCFHGFFLGAVEKNGLPIIADLNTQCKGSANREQCQHGIGHGILVYLGEGHLKEALGACRSISGELLNRGCVNGVFMEYFHRFHQAATGNETGETLRPVDRDHLEEPCPSVPEDFRHSCRILLAMRLMAYFRSDTLVANMCDSLYTSQERDGCFNGIGREMLYEEKLDVISTVNRCQKLPSHAALECRAQVANRLYELPTVRNQATLPCQDLNPAQERYCLSKAAMNPERICADLKGTEFNGCVTRERESFP